MKNRYDIKIIHHNDAILRGTQEPEEDEAGAVPFAEEDTKAKLKRFTEGVQVK